ncbi:MAG: hypothetical protein FWF06_08020 [Symbiobacteriaceae bacterium]|nr:hypothetical protein [Symbiobacteriaceae bacterium]
MRKNNRPGFLLLVVGLVSLAIGLAQGAFRETMFKGILICLECIGIG